MKTFLTPLLSLFALVLLCSWICVNPLVTHLRAGQDLQATIREARELRRLGRVAPTDTLYITIPDGEYHLTSPLLLRPEDSGTPQGPTVLRAAHPGRAIIDGGVALQGWRRPTAAEARDVPAAVRQQLWVCDAPRVNGRIVHTRQLWQDGRRLPQASLVPTDSLLPMLGFDRQRREIVIPTSVLPGAQVLTSGFQCTMLVHQRWAIALLRIASMRTEADGTHVTFFEPESLREFDHPWPQPVIGDTLSDGRIVSSSFNLLGAPVLLDRPGEWVQRYPDGLIYMLSDAPGGAAPAAPVIIPVAEQLVQVQGTISRPVHDIQFEGLTFRHTQWNTPASQGWVTLQAGLPIIDAYKLHQPGLPHKASLENQAWIGRPQSAITLSGVQRIHFDRCTVTHTGACGIDYTEAASTCHVTQCSFTDIGSTAILVGHFPDGGYETHVPFVPDSPEQICHDITLSHNRVADIGMDDWGACAINAGYVHHTTIADNEVSGCKWSGICLGWGWLPRPASRSVRRQWTMHHNHLLRNYVHHFGQQLHDCGALYTLSWQPYSTIVGNRLEQMGHAPFATNDRVFYIYFDEATDAFDVHDNQMPELRVGYNQPGPDLRTDF